jgi:outer membrane protein TolC
MRRFSRSCWLATLAGSLLAATVPAHAAEGAASNELAGLVRTALTNSPAVRAAHERLAQAESRAAEVDAFLDPQLSAGAGWAEGTPDTPGIPASLGLPNDAMVAQGSITLPVPPGAYVGVGAAERFLNRLDGYEPIDQLYQTVVGARVRVPLLQDRGFSRWKAQGSVAAAGVRQAAADLLATEQALRHDVELRYIAAQEALAGHRIAVESTQRFKALLDEASELIRLKVVPAYQVEPARLEWNLGREEEAAALEQYQINLRRLAETVALDAPPVLDASPRLLLDLAAAPLPAAATNPVALEARGEHASLLQQRDGLNGELRLAREALQSDLALEIGGTWTGEDPDQPLGTEAITVSDRLGAQAMLVWKRPWGFQAADRQQERLLARGRELDANLGSLRIRLEADQAAALTALQSGLARLQYVSDAVEAARHALDAERERFRLGEGRSRQVLDAQKDLTKAMQRQVAIAAALLRARSDGLYAAGYPEGGEASQ